MGQPIPGPIQSGGPVTVRNGRRVTSEDYLGVLEVMSNGRSGFIRRPQASYTPSSEDVYVGQRVIQKHSLRTGDEICGEVGTPPGSGKSPPLKTVYTVNGVPAEELGHRPQFHRLSAIHPNQQLTLECGLERRGQADHTNRIIDMFCPLGKGQRAMIVAPSKAGKTFVLQAIAEGILRNDPEALVYILLVDERPEEVTEMQQHGYGEVVASSFDYPAERHVQVAEITLERARRRVEMGQDVVIILDSITRLARAYNNVEEGTGRTLTGGLDASALDKPKRFLGSARCVDPKQGEGSLTIIATALVDTGSRMDQVIFEEFKGTGNSELVLSRDLADRRLWPAIDLQASATRREELLLPDAALNVSHAMRRELADMSPEDAISEVLGIMGRTSSNADLIEKAASRI